MRTLRVVSGLAWLAAATTAWGQMATDQALTLLYPPGHWSGIQTVNFNGTEATPAASPIRELGWWYRVEGDTREHPFPPPSRVIDGEGVFTAIWDDLGGIGVRVWETTRLYDTEGPSGEVYSSVVAANLGAAAKTVHFFNFVHVGAGGTFDVNDTAVLRAPGFVKFTDRLTGDVVRYRAYAPTHFQVGAWPAISALLSDANPTTLNDGGLPFGPGHAEAAFQRTAALQPAAMTLVTSIALSSRSVSDYVRGSRWGQPYPGLLTYDPVAQRQAIRDFRRTAYISGDYFYSDPSSRIEAFDDFFGDAVSNVLRRDTATGAVTIGGFAVSDPRGPEWLLGSTGDFNGDGKVDLLWRNALTQQLEVWLMNGSRRIGMRVPQPPAATDANWRLAGSADFDGDGSRDLLWQNDSSRNVVIWFLDGAQRRVRSTFTTPTSAGAGWRIVAVGDFGRGPGGVANTQDLVWQNDTSHRVVVWHLNRAGVRTSGLFTTPDTLPNAESVVGPR